MVLNGFGIKWIVTQNSHGLVTMVHSCLGGIVATWHGLITEMEQKIERWDLTFLNCVSIKSGNSWSLHSYLIIRSFYEINFQLPIFVLFCSWKSSLFKFFIKLQMTQIHKNRKLFLFFFTGSRELILDENLINSLSNYKI